jgi:hypothetical protein
MNNITVTFTYDLPDDQYYQTNDLKKVATNVYNGPEKVYVLVDSSTNKLTGGQISQTQHEYYNKVNTRDYSVEVDCNEDTLICSFFNGSVDPDRQQISEDIHLSMPYVRPEPPLPDHTYEIREVEYNQVTGKFKKPTVWKQPFVVWEETPDHAGKIHWRNKQLAATDRQMSEDLPESLYNRMIAHRQYLRDFTTTYGVSWLVTMISGGTGFAVGDRIAITDSKIKNGQMIDDVIITVTAVNNGAITEFTTSSTRALQFKDAVTFANVYYTTNGAGLNANFTVSKVKTVDPWKITPIPSPLG